MIRQPFSSCVPWMCCVWLSAAAMPASAQLSINIDDAGVSLQNGSQAPLVVGPGQSFGGTLTPNGFQGVMSGAQGVRSVQPMANPFLDKNPAVPASSKPLQINAGGISVSLPGATMPAAVMKSEPMTAQKFAAVRSLARMAEPEDVVLEIDRMLMRSPGSSDLLQLKAVMLMKMAKMREAAACCYEALVRGPVWTWPMLRACFDSKESAERMYRVLQKELEDRPTVERQLLLAWWERMLGHERESVMALEAVMESLPKDVYLMRLHEDWALPLEAEAPPAAQP